MRYSALLCTLFACGSIVAPYLFAQDDAAAATETSDETADDLDQLRTLREELTEAVIAGDVESQVKYVTTDVVTIWQNNQVAKGHDGLRELLSDIGEGEEKIFQGYTERPSSDDVEILPGGNVAIAHGTSTPHYKWMGMEFDLENRWSATLVKSDEGWKIATYHVSGNLADNPVLTAAKQSIIWIASIAVLIGVVLGVLIGRLMARPAASGSK